MSCGGEKSIWKERNDLSKRHLFYIAQSNYFIKVKKIIGIGKEVPLYPLYMYKDCWNCGNVLMDCCCSFSKCYNWYKRKERI